MIPAMPGDGAGDSNDDNECGNDILDVGTVIIIMLPMTMIITTTMKITTPVGTSDCG